MVSSLLVVIRQCCWTAVLILLTACADESVRSVNRDPGLEQAVSEPEYWRGREVIWAGTLVALHNLADGSQLEVLAYPLVRDGEPDLDAVPLGRFLAQVPGYLEPLDYVPGRLLQVRGRLAGNQDGRVGAAELSFPLVEADELELLMSPRDEPRLYFGIGISGGHR